MSSSTKPTDVAAPMAASRLCETKNLEKHHFLIWSEFITQMTEFAEILETDFAEDG
jgi:hypothetical protein